MEAVIEAIPQTGDIRLTIEVSARQNFSARSAQRVVGRFVADEISYLLRAGEPDLVVSKRFYLDVPHYMQKGPADCLAACAAMVLAYHGKSTSYNKLLDLLHIGPIGAPEGARPNHPGYRPAVT